MSIVHREGSAIVKLSAAAILLFLLLTARINVPYRGLWFDWKRIYIGVCHPEGRLEFHAYGLRRAWCYRFGKGWLP